MIVYDRTGAGAPLVLIHGLGSRRGVWDPVVPALAESFEVLAIDLPGFGDSPRNGTGASIEAQAQRVEQWFAEVGIERPHVAGNSMGGAIALELARRGAVRSATAVGPAGFWTARERAYTQVSMRANRMLARVIAPAAPALAATAAGRMLEFQMRARPWAAEPDAVVGDIRGIAAATALEACADAFTGHVFSDGDELRGTPVTIAWGDKDRLLFYGRQSARARAALPWARHVTLTGCGHLPFSDDPEQVAAVLAAAARED